MFVTILSIASPLISLLTLIFVAGMKYNDLKQLTKTMDRIENKVNSHAERIARIEGCLEIKTKDGE